jgi:aryl-alcohol dehydrogenase-like predicted oxidoreductase
VESSLRRLGTEYIDLYQVHCWDPGTPLEETLSTLDTLVRSGKVRYIGASNYSGWQLQKAIDLSRQHNWEPFTCLQPLYNLLDRNLEFELTHVCLNEGLGIIPWSPLRGGWLSGKYQRGMAAPVAGTRIEQAREGRLERILERLRHRTHLARARRTLRRRRREWASNRRKSRCAGYCSAPASPRRSSVCARWSTWRTTSAPRLDAERRSRWRA